MTILDHALRHVQRHGMTERQALNFLTQFTHSQDGIGWNDPVPFLSAALTTKLDTAAARWLTNPANAAKPEPPTVRQSRDRKRAAAGDDPEAA